MTVRKHLLNGNEYERDPRSTHTLEFPEEEYDTALVLPQHAQRSEEIQDDRDTDDTENVGPTHGGPSGRPRMDKTRANETRRCAR